MRVRSRRVTSGTFAKETGAEEEVVDNDDDNRLVRLSALPPLFKENKLKWYEQNPSL